MQRASVIRRLGHRTYDWLKYSHLITDDGVKATLKGFSARRDEVNKLLATYGSEPEAVNFNHYRSVLKDTSLVDALEAEYNRLLKNSKSAFDSPEYKEFLSGFDGNVDGARSVAQEQVGKINAELQSVEHEVSLLKQNRTTYETTVDDVLKQFPHFEEEIDEEIANYDFK